MSVVLDEFTALAEPATFRWTRQQYEHAAEIGLFSDRNVQLIGGKIFEMAPQKNRHAMGVMRLDYALKRVFHTGFLVRVQMPLALTAASEPEPDLAVVAGSLRDNQDEHPATALLIVEVSDRTLQFDQTIKKSLYASCQLPEYWILNLVHRKLEVYRTPLPDPSAPFGFCYAEQTVLVEGQVVYPLAAPTMPVSVTELIA